MAISLLYLILLGLGLLEFRGVNVDSAVNKHTLAVAVIAVGSVDAQSLVPGISSMKALRISRPGRT